MVYLRAGSERCTLRRHPERVLRAKRRDAARVVPVENLVKLGSQRTNLLGYYQGYFHCFLSGVRRFSSDDSGCPYVVFYLTRLGYQALPREVLFHAGFRVNATLCRCRRDGYCEAKPQAAPRVHFGFVGWNAVKICSRVAGSSPIPESRAVTTPFSSWQGELQDRPSWRIGRRLQTSIMSFGNQTANRQAHSLPLRFSRKEGLEGALHFRRAQRSANLAPRFALSSLAIGVTSEEV